MIDELAITQTDDALYGEESAAEEATGQFISFRLGSEWYGISISQVREVVRVGQIAFLPSAPAHIAGAINLRGNIVSVTDAKRLFGFAPMPLAEQNRIVVIETATAETGLLVDQVGEVITIPLNELEPPLVTFETAQANYIEHTCRWNDRLMAILKVDRLIDSRELSKTSASQNEDPYKTQQEK